MVVRPILRWPDPRLAELCDPVAVDDDSAALAADMLETMYAASGRGLAAPQIGVNRRIFVMDVAWKSGPPDPQVMVNPEILWMSDDRATGPEGCLSIPGVLADVSRASEITLRWTDASGARRQETLTGFAAICAQHETDHLDGIVTFDRLDAPARAALLADYQP